MSFVDQIKQNEKIGERFWSKVDRSGGPESCWLWKAAIDTPGYGAFKINNKKVNSHRVAYALTHYEWLTGMDVRHSCDNRLCCNPKHLISGTRRENVQDAMQRGRVRSGQLSGTAKITDEQAKAIRKLTKEHGITPWLVSQAVGISDKAVTYIRDGITWKHLA